MPGSISIRGAHIVRGSFSLDVESLEIAPREIFAILGKTGSGKTVLMESIMGAHPLARGQILLDGTDVTKLPIRQRRLGVLYQDYALFPHMTVYDNIAYGLRCKGLGGDAVGSRVREMTELLDISHLEHRHPGVISGGEAQRVGLARALVLSPRILMLDEPFSALDPMTKRCMYGMLGKIHERFGCTIIFVTHDFGEAQVLADRVGIIMDGRLRFVVDADRLFESEYDEDVRDFLGMRGRGRVDPPPHQRTPDERGAHVYSR